MGNLCSKSANEADPFARPGRVLGNSSQPSPGPPRRNLTANTPGRTLGGSESTTAAEDARRAAARAAEVLIKSPPTSRIEHTVYFQMAVLAITNLQRRSISHLSVLTLDHRSVQPNPRKARASSLRNSWHRRSRRETSFWLPAPSKSAVHVTLTRPLKLGATINDSGVYHSSRLSRGHFSERFP